MDKRWKGYMTVEAAYVMPLVIALYLLVLTAAFFVYERCVVSQDYYLLALRGSRFTAASDDYGEVIYAEGEKAAGIKEYVRDRLHKRTSYSFYDTEKSKAVVIEGDRICVFSMGYSGTVFVKKEAERMNPVEAIREGGNK